MFRKMKRPEKAQEKSLCFINSSLAPVAGEFARERPPHSRARSGVCRTVAKPALHILPPPPTQIFPTHTTRTAFLSIQPSHSLFPWFHLSKPGLPLTWNLAYDTELPLFLLSAGLGHRGDLGASPQLANARAARDDHSVVSHCPLRVVNCSLVFSLSGFL